MNRRTYLKGMTAIAAALILPTQAHAQSTGKFIAVTQEYGEEAYAWDITHTAVWLEHEEAAKVIFANEDATALESSELFFLIEPVDDAPTFGDESITVIGKHDADTLWLQVVMRTGVVIQKFTFAGEDRDALIADSIAMIEAALARQEYKSEYTDAELFALLLTEEETGLPITDQQYETQQYNLDNL